MDFDPICGKRVASGLSTPAAEYKKRRYFFCSEACRRDFERDAERLRLQELARVGALLSQGRVRWGVA